MPGVTYEQMVEPQSTARGVASNTFTTAKDITPVVPGMPTIPANELKVGSIVDLEAWGEFTCATGITLALGFAYGVTAGGLASTGVTLAQSAAIATGTTPTAWPWHLKWTGKVTAIGTSGVIYGQGILDLGTSLTALSPNALPVTAAARSVTIDTTVAKTIAVIAAYGTSGAGNGVICDIFTPKIVNQNRAG